MVFSPFATAVFAAEAEEGKAEESVSSANSKLEEIDLSTIKVTPTYADDTVGNLISYSALTLGEIDLATAGEQILTVAYYGVTAEVEITVKGIASLLVEGYAKKVVIGDTAAVTFAKLGGSDKLFFGKGSIAL